MSKKLVIKEIINSIKKTIDSKEVGSMSYISLVMKNILRMHRYYVSTVESLLKVF